MIVNTFGLFSNIVMKLTSSISSCDSSLVLAQSFGDKFGNMIISFFANLIYVVCKWLLYFLDIIFFYIRQISGADVDTSSLTALSSGESDMVFKMLLTDPKSVSLLIRQLVGIVLVVIIIITIIAVIKSHYDAIRDNTPGDNAAILKRTLKSILLIVITPIIAIGGIMMSNILLKTLYNATNVTGATSVGSSIFSLSSSSANSYRIYATNGKRIPIFFEFSQQERYLDQIDKNELTQKGIEYLTSEDNPTYQTHLMFDNQDYYSFDYLNNADNLKKYYDLYDKSGVVKDENYQKLRVFREEYFVMADVIDYAVKTSQKLYIKTIEEVLESVKVQEDFYNDFLRQYDITVGSDIISYFSNLYSYDDLNMEAGAVKQIQYNHKVGQKDELYGAVFIVAVEKTKEINGVNYTYYEPFVEGFRQNNYGVPFESDFIREGNIIAAKGIFTSSQLPTAIKRDRNSSDIIFYRDNLKEYDLGDVAGIAQLYEEEDKSLFQGIKETFQSIFNPSALIPKVDYNEDAIKVTYRKQTIQEGLLNNGALHISYMFSNIDNVGINFSQLFNSFSGVFTNKKSALNVTNFFVVTKFNFLILVMGSYLLFKVCATAIFALIKRIYDLFLLFIFYPTACATMPLDDDKGYNKWMTSFVGKLFSTYGLILGINFILMVVPIMENVQFFTATEITSSRIIRRVGYLFFYLNTPVKIANLLNLTVAVLFQLVAFSLLEGSGIVKMMSQLFPGEEDITTNNPATQMAAVLTDMSKVVAAVGKVASGVGTGLSLITPKGRNKFKQDAKTKLERLVPGSAIYNEVKDANFRRKKKKEQKDALNDLKEALDSSSSSKEEVEKKMNAFLKAQEAYTKSLSSDKKGGSSTRAQREAEADQIKQEKSKHFMENSRDGDGLGGNMFDGFSDDEIQKRMKEAEKFIKKNEKKHSKGKLDDSKDSKYLEAESFLSGATAELERRKQRKEEIEELTNKISSYEEKLKNGTITDNEKAELESSKANLDKYNEEIDREQQAFDIKHNKKKRREYEKEKKKQEADSLLFRHESKGKYGRKQKQRLAELQKNISEAEKGLVANGLGGYIGNMSMEEIKTKLADEHSDLSNSERRALQDYYDAVKYKQDMLAITDNEYTNAAAMNARVQAKKDEDTLASRNPFGGISRNRRTKSVNKDISSYAAELEQINNQLAAQSTVNIDSINYDERRKLNERRAFLEQKLREAQHWNDNNSKEGIEKIRTRKKVEKHISFVDKYTNLTQHAIAYLESKNMPITEENINRYIANVQKGRAMRKKK